MTQLRSLERVEFETPAVPASTLGPKGELKWIALDKIIIDPVYQRDVGQPGRKNIKQIVENFRWSLFSPLIVARREGGLFAAIDGQHRAIAALTHGGIKDVPCWVIKVDEAEEASAFAVINGQVTALNPLHVFRAKVVAGDPESLRVVKVAEQAGVTIMRNPTAGQMLKHGECQSPNAIAGALEWLGEEIAVKALECVTRTGDNPGQLRGVVISAFAEVMARAPNWRVHKKLFAVLKDAGVKTLYAAATVAQAEQGGALRAHLVEAIETVLDERLGGIDEAPLPPTPAARKREADRAAGLDKAAKARAGRKGSEKRVAEVAERRRAAEAARIFTAPKAKPPAAAKPQDTRALIEAHIATKGVNKVPEGATANPSVMTDYLRGRGYDVAFIAREGKCRIGKRLYDLKGLIAFYERERTSAARQLQKVG